MVEASPLAYMVDAFRPGRLGILQEIGLRRIESDDSSPSS
jgi:hypothetical protein